MNAILYITGIHNCPKKKVGGGEYSKKQSIASKQKALQELLHRSLMNQSIV